MRGLALSYSKEKDMKNLVWTLLFLSFTAVAQIEVEAPVQHLFVPHGFDNNDNVEMVVTGKFPNTCFSLGKTEVEVEGEVIRITVNSLFRGIPYPQCQPLSVPFTQTVTIGSLQAGNYKVIVNGGTAYELKNTIAVVESASHSVDEHLYLAVDYVELGFTGGHSGSAVLVGHAISPCLEFDRVEYLSNKQDTLSILPIMKKVSDHCPEQKTRVEVPIKFDPRKFPHKQLLLFVRSIEGKSVYSIVE
jgi:hypothetical protein